MPVKEEISKAIEKAKDAIGKGAKSVERIASRIGGHSGRKAKRAEERAKNTTLPSPSETATSIPDSHTSTDSLPEGLTLKFHHQSIQDPLDTSAKEDATLSTVSLRSRL